ncbi:MAG: hypothetical protein ABI461_21220 [Polyangiaceae bacterium]
MRQTAKCIGILLGSAIKGDRFSAKHALHSIGAFGEPTFCARRRQLI